MAHGGKIKIEELVETFMDGRVVEAIAKALAPFVSKTVSDALSKSLEGLTTDIAQLKDENKQLRVQILDQGQQIDALEAYSRSDNLVVRGMPEHLSDERVSAYGGANRVSHLDSVSSVESSFISFCKSSPNVVVQLSDISSV